MRVVIKADEGDQVTVHADQLAIEQSLVRLEFDNQTFGSPDFDSMSLSLEQASALARALVATVQMITAVKNFGLVAADLEREQFQPMHS